MPSDVVAEAITLIKAGKRTEAQKLLEPFIEVNPQNIGAWMWEAETWPTIAGRIKVLEMCLQHNAENLQVQQALEKLKNLQTTQELKEPKQQQITQKPESKEQQPSKSDVASSSGPADKICPKCGLRNVGWVTTCDCGFNFALKTYVAPVQPASSPRRLSQRPMGPEKKSEPVSNIQPVSPGETTTDRPTNEGTGDTVLNRHSTEEGNSMKIINFLGGVLFAGGLILFLYGAFDQMAINISTQFGYTGITQDTYQIAMEQFKNYQVYGGIASALGAGLAFIRK